MPRVHLATSTTEPRRRPGDAPEKVGSALLSGVDALATAERRKIRACQLELAKQTTTNEARINLLNQFATSLESVPNPAR